MKASEIFTQYTLPIQEAVPADGDAATLQKILSVPALVWNVCVLDQNKRKLGDLPKILRDQLRSVPANDRPKTRAMLKFWVDRKDHLFGPFNWPIDIEVYKNLKGQLIIRAKVLQPKHFDPDLPEEWQKPKPLATVLSLNTAKN